MLSYEFCSINGCTLTKRCEESENHVHFFSVVVKYSSKIKI